MTNPVVPTTSIPKQSSSSPELTSPDRNITLAAAAPADTASADAASADTASADAASADTASA
ncbi:hypothetical protein, partial [Actinocatenispora thailandica]|uniref:hypothetical protein n=1 Tax=Actinocatenispora thailandica TaxID=227318 RepID=UPI0031D853F3